MTTCEEDPSMMVNIFNQIVRRPKIYAMLVVMDETHNYCMSEEENSVIKSIKCTYLYDKRCKTHLCEMTASYYLIHLYTYVTFTDKGEELDEFEKQEYYEKFEQSTGDDENKYYHCCDIDRMPNTKKRKVGLTKVSYKDVEYDDQMESLREHYSCNHYL